MLPASSNAWNSKLLLYYACCHFYVQIHCQNSALQSKYKDILYNETNITNFRKQYPVRLNALTFPKMLFITKGKTLHSHANHSHSSSVAFIYCFCLVCVVTFLLAQSYLFMLIIDANIRLIGMHVTQVITLLWFQYHHSSHSP